MLDKFMRQLAADMEAGDALTTGVPGVYTIPVNEDIAVTISEVPRGFSLRCNVADRPNGEEKTFYTQALLANLYGRGTEGAILGLDPEGEVLTLSRSIDYSLDYNEFRDIVEDFLNSVDFWHNEVKTYGVK